jgi:outer membrane receptor protein involved in Fe transport
VPPPQGLGGLLPAAFSYRNIGELTDTGVELSLDYRPSAEWRAFFNYSWQDEPETEGIDPVTLPSGRVVPAVNIPPEHRVNLGASFNGERIFASAVVNYVDEAFWTDVLDSRFWGFTDSYTAVNGTIGTYLGGDRVTISLTGHNIFDEEIQQHIFGDIIARKVTGQLLFRF